LDSVNLAIREKFGAGGPEEPVFAWLGKNPSDQGVYEDVEVGALGIRRIIRL
jgi:hypothetical protein